MKQWVFKPSEALKLLPTLIQHIQTLPEQAYSLELKRYYPKRSLDANAYAWVLINRIAGIMALDPEEVYRQAIQKCGGNIEYMAVKNEAVESFKRIWGKQGLGWMVRELGPCKNVPGCTTLACYYGSSAFDAKQMHNLIENLVQDAEALEIETMTPDERDRLVSLWE